MFVVVTVFSLWLGWQAKIVTERREALADQRWDFYKSANAPRYVHQPMPTIPFWRRWLGDEAVYLVHVNATDDDPQFDKLRQLFPEATVVGPLTPGWEDRMGGFAGRYWLLPLERAEARAALIRSLQQQ